MVSSKILDRSNTKSSLFAPKNAPHRYANEPMKYILGVDMIVLSCTLPSRLFEQIAKVEDLKQQHQQMLLGKMCAWNRSKHHQEEG